MKSQTGFRVVPGTLKAMTGEEPTTEQLRAVQAGRASAEHERSQHASTPAEKRAAVRRADKAAYLRDKLDEQARSDREQP